MKNVCCFVFAVLALVMLAEAMPAKYELEGHPVMIVRARRSPGRIIYRRVNRRQDNAEETPVLCKSCDLVAVVPEDEKKDALPEVAPLAEVAPEEAEAPAPTPVAKTPKEVDSDEDEDDDDDFPFGRKGYKGVLNTFFPIAFGGSLTRSEASSGPGGYIAVANSFSTGHKSVASSQAKAYGGAEPKN